MRVLSLVAAVADSPRFPRPPPPPRRRPPIRRPARRRPGQAGHSRAARRRKLPEPQSSNVLLACANVRLGLLLRFELMPEHKQARLPPPLANTPTPAVSAPQVPVRSLETTPGTVIVFTEEVWHGSFGSDVGRLQITSQVRAPQTAACSRDDDCRDSEMLSIGCLPVMVMPRSN